MIVVFGVERFQYLTPIKDGINLCFEVTMMAHVFEIYANFWSVGLPTSLKNNCDDINNWVRLFSEREAYSKGIL